MPNMIRYECDGRSAIWAIPFAYADTSQVRVNVQLEDGTERPLTEGVDYIISGASCYCVRPAGDRLIIWLNAPPASSAEMTRAQAAQAVNVQPTSLYDEASPAGDTGNAIDERLATALAQIEEWTRLGSERIRTEHATSLASLQAALQEGISDALRKLATAVRDLEDKGSALANQAQAYSLAASRSASDAQLAQSGIMQARDVGDNAAITAQGWANASQKSADESWRASASAWDAATQASIHSRRPGICAVADISAIHACSPGLFIINEHLTHAPTPFFGVWPAKTIEDMAWDAVFFTSPYLYPDDPRLPPPVPERPKPDPVAATGSNDQWLPCNHQHEDTIIYSSCPVCNDCKGTK